MENQDTFINVDVNEVRLDGTPNPYFRRPYIQTTNPLYQVRFEDYDMGRLQPIAINPDGVPYAYRIVDPRQFIPSASFDL